MKKNTIILDLDDTIFQTKSMDAKIFEPFFKHLVLNLKPNFNQQDIERITSDLWQRPFDVVIKKYNIEDYQKIEKVLLKYIDLCYRANFDKVMLIEYYIMKDNSSKFATDYEDFDENEDSELKTDEGVYLI